ncbi:MAG: gas vesicle protein [Parvularculaceae bacterium]|nr:gas vesicle protein [Parvularculaceae bacterium]
MLTSIQATKLAREAIDLLVEKPIEAVISCERNNDGFVVRVEICDTKAHIADNDILATYELCLDKETGDVLRYERLTRARRSDSAVFAA